MKEKDVYPADPEDGYGWEKLFSERMCRHFMEDYGIEVRIARYHNIYGPFGTYDGGREKAQQLYVEKLSMQKNVMKIQFKFGEMGNRQEVFIYRRLY